MSVLAGSPFAGARIAVAARAAAARFLLAWVILLGVPALTTFAAEPADARAAALRQLADTNAGRRLDAVQVLAASGTMADVEPLVRALRDASEPVRDAAAAALWKVWSRSGHAAVDLKLAEGSRLVSQGDLAAALVVFDDVVRTLPAFAEGWNKRATVLFLLGRHADSLRDCDEVLKRNPLHFGALSGMAQIHAQRGDVEQALEVYERALAVNPNLVGAAAVLKMLEEAVEEKRKAQGGQKT
jgi:tetratricopeptide (TPR) repeat protein